MAFVLEDIEGKRGVPGGERRAVVKTGLLPQEEAEFVAVLGNLDRFGDEVRALAESLETGVSPARIVERRGLEQIADRDTLAATVDAVLADHGSQVDEYRRGKTALRGFFVGQVMKATAGKANPQLVNQLLRRHLNA